MNREHWLGAIRARIDRYLVTGDVDALLAARADHEATQLALALRPDRRGKPDTAGLQALGELRWYGYLALAERGQQAEERLDTALRHFAGLPRNAPEPVAAMFKRAGSAARDPAAALTLTRQAVESDDRARLNHAIETMYCAIAVAVGDPTANGLVDELSRVLSIALMRRDNPGDVDRAITRFTWQRDSDQARGLLGQARALRGERTGNLAELGDAIAVLRQTVQALPPGHPEASEWVGALANALYARALLTADSIDLNAAITAKREAIRLAAAEGFPEPKNIADLSVMLRHRYDDTGDGDALNDALEYARLAAKAGPSPYCQATLGRVLVAQFQRTGQVAYLEDAVALFRRQVAIEQNHETLTDLGTALVLRPDGDDIGQAVAALRHAVAVAPAGRTRAEALTNLGAALVKTGDPALSDEIVEIYRQACAETREPVDRVSAMHSYASALAARGDFDAAIGVSRSLAKMSVARPVSRLNAARRWGEWAARAGLWADSVEGYRQAVELLPHITPRHLHLAGWHTLASDAAAAALNIDRPDLALELLEQARASLTSAALQQDRELDELRAVEPDLAAAVDSLREALGKERANAVRRHELTAQWSQMLATVRKSPGFSQFLCAPTIDVLQAAAQDGPVVTVNVGAYRCDALILESAGVRVVRLPGLRQEDLAERVRAFEAENSIGATLQWLWDNVTGPVLDAVHADRIWWSPTGDLNFLPLHAAGDAIDRVVSSYTPTISALTRARRPPSPDSGRPLVVAMPETPGQLDLPSAVAEATHLGKTNGVEPLIGPQATRDNVLDALRQSDWVHFACHANHDAGNPATSHLSLYDQSISVTDIDRLRMPNADLAYLSACSTERGRGEAIQLGAAFHLAGFRHVVATLWRVNDATAAQVAAGFYAHRDDLGTAKALHEAVQQVRQAYPLLPSRWAGYIHTGP